MALLVWKTDDNDFRRNFAGLIKKLSLDEGLRAAGTDEREPPREVVRRIVEDVRARGDAAVLEYTDRFDGCALRPEQLQVGADEIEAALARCPADLLGAMEFAAERIRGFQEAILLRDPPPIAEGGRTLSLRYRPVDSAGIHVPGASASLASSVLMAAVPAVVAGVGRIAMVTPPRQDGTVSDDRLVAARVAGVHEVYRVGGAQAIAALAFGTETIPAVDFIAGPGNIYTMLAKKEVFGQVGIEMLPGPSEVVIIADESADARYVAADLIAQAEHNPGSAVLLTDCEGLADTVVAAVESQVAALPCAGAVRTCLDEYGAVIVASSLAECADLANELAPEHLEIVTRAPEQVAEQVRHSGAIFLGPWSPVAAGDYVAGPSHILPTSGTARFSSGLSANDFLKRSSVVCYDREALQKDASSIARLARSEGLEGHARSVELRGAKGEDQE